MKINKFALFLSLFASVLCHAQELESNVPDLSVSGENRFGVVDAESGNIVVDTVYQYVEIIEGNILQCMYDRYSDGEREIVLPGYVMEVFNVNGDLVYRSCDNLLSADRPPYSATISFAQYKGYKDVEAAALFKAAMNYETEGLRREAFRDYVAAYKLCPEIKVAKERAMAIRGDLASERAAVQAQLDAEALQRQLEAEQRAAALNAVAAALNSTASSLKQIQASQQQQKQRAAASAAAAAAAKQNKAVASESSSSSSSSSSSASSSKSSDSKKKTSKTSSTYHSSAWLYEDDGKCTLCNGSKKCPFCHNGKVLGPAVRTCDYCKGSNVCQRCKGTGKSK